MFVAPAALGVTPQQIYRDYADNGRLDQRTRRLICALRRSSSLQGYPQVGVQGAVEQALGAQPVKPRGGLPFTGVDLALMAAGGALLLGAGTTLRKLGKARK